MAVVSLRSPLRDLAGGQGSIPIDGGTVGEVIADLERAYPRLIGWVRDETGAVRQHVNVFVNGERAGLETSVEAKDHVHVLASISGGAVETMTRPEQSFRSSDEHAELLVGTRKGLFVLRGGLGQPMELAGRSFDGSIVEFAMRDRRSGRYHASVTNGFFGPRMYFADDPTGEWQQAEGPAFPEDADAAIERIWVIRTGVEPDVL